MGQINSSLIIFTSLDSLVLDAENNGYESVLSKLEWLKARHIPVIPVTSKTREEVEIVRRRMNLTDPFIVEGGSGVYIPLDYNQFELPQGETVGNYRLIQLGCSYVMARAGLKAIAQSLGRPLKGFGDWSAEQLNALTGLSAADAHRAKAREFTELFKTPKNIPIDKLKQAVHEMGFEVVVSDRFSHLIGHEAGVGRAVKHLTQHYQSALPVGQHLTTVGLGDSLSDLALLENVDIPIIVSGLKGEDSDLSKHDWPVAASPGPQGWAIAIDKICQDEIFMARFGAKS
ncbi:MAG: haloacid dehalogenase [Leptolyngbyaceae cyanobacterium MO_188.B28]|nr:haloacid dehalogenase [Leptolyngbyaceae cyanobacterium MO_188.B28]